MVAPALPSHGSAETLTAFARNCSPLLLYQGRENYREGDGNVEKSWEGDSLQQGATAGGAGAPVLHPGGPLGWDLGVPKAEGDP